MKYLIANLKARFNLQESLVWIDTFIKTLDQMTELKNALNDNKFSLILAPSTPFVLVFHEKIKNYHNITIAAQNISAYGKGTHTGECTAYSLMGYVSYAIVGHSERRIDINEKVELIANKLLRAKESLIEPILCVRTLEEYQASPTQWVAYEPQDAIGTGHVYDTTKIESFRAALQLPSGSTFLYGGSVDRAHIDSFKNCMGLDGLLVGTAALDPKEFVLLADSYAT